MIGIKYGEGEKEPASIFKVVYTFSKVVRYIINIKK
jgi:hypothetical protein